MENNVLNFKFIKKMPVLEIALFIIFLLAQVLVSIFFNNTVINFILFITNFLYIVLASYKSFWLFIVGIIGPFFLGYVCLQNGLYGQLILNICGFVPLQIIGFYSWLRELKKSKKSQSTNNVENPMQTQQVDSRKLSPKQWIVFLITFVALFALTQFGLSQIDSQKLSYADAFVTVGSLFGTILITFRFAENWWVYLVVNIVSSILWVQLALDGAPDAPSLFVTQIAYVVWSIIGLIKWYKQPKQIKKENIIVSESESQDLD